MSRDGLAATQGNNVSIAQGAVAVREAQQLRHMVIADLFIRLSTDHVDGRYLQFWRPAFAVRFTPIIDAATCRRITVPCGEVLVRA